MKTRRIITAVLLALALCLSAAAAEENAAAPEGSWRICGGTDDFDTLVFHADGTMEAYNLVFDRLPEEGKGYLRFAGAFEVKGNDLTMPDGQTYHIEYITLENDMEIGNMGPEVPAGSKVLNLYQDPEEESQLFGLYAPCLCPAVPAPEELPEKCELNGETVSLKDAAYEDGRLTWEGKQYSLQLTPVQLPDDYDNDEQMEAWEQADRWLSVAVDEAQEQYASYALTCDVLMAYPLDGGEPLRFEAK